MGWISAGAGALNIALVAGAGFAGPWKSPKSSSSKEGTGRALLKPPAAGAATAAGSSKSSISSKLTAGAGSGALGAAAGGAVVERRICVLEEAPEPDAERELDRRAETTSSSPASYSS